MEIKCPVCDCCYDVAISLVGEHVECQCGHCWFWREEFPTIQPAYDLWSDTVVEEVCDTNGRFIGYRVAENCHTISYLPSKELYDTAKEKFNKSKKIEDIDYAYEFIKQLCVDTSPAPAVFNLFFKLCRIRNISDKKAGKYQAVVDRIEFMLTLEQKKHEILYISYGKNVDMTLEQIQRTSTYISITKTDYKNLEICKEKLR